MKLRQKLTQYMRDDIYGDIIATICVLFYIGLVYYISYTPFNECKTFDPKVAEHDIHYRQYYTDSLKCERAAEREILTTRPLSIHGLFGRLVDTKTYVMREKDVKYQDWIYMVYVGIILALKWGLNAVLVAVHLDCWLLAFTIFFTWFVHGCFYHMRWRITWVVWFISYGVLVSKLYGETFDIMVILLSYFAFFIFIIGLAIGMILTFFGRP